MRSKINVHLMTSQILKNDQYIIIVTIQMGNGTVSDRVNIPCLLHDTLLCLANVTMTNN